MDYLRNIDLKRAYKLLQIPFLAPIDEVAQAHRALTRHYNSPEYVRNTEQNLVNLKIQQINKAFKRITTVFKTEYSLFEFESQLPQLEPKKNAPIKFKLNLKNLKGIEKNHKKRFELPLNVPRSDGSFRPLSKRFRIDSTQTLMPDIVLGLNTKESSSQINKSIVIVNSNVNMGNVNINSNQDKTEEKLQEIPTVPNKNDELEILFDLTSVYKELGLFPDESFNQYISFRLENIYAGGVEYMKVFRKLIDSNGIERKVERILRFEIEQGIENCTRVYIPVKWDDSMFKKKDKMTAPVDEDELLIGNVMSSERREQNLHSDSVCFDDDTQNDIDQRNFDDNDVHPNGQKLKHDASLNPNDKSLLLKLSVNCLFARNDHELFQSVRSHCAASSDIYYYEAHLFSGGSIRIGWATKQTDLNGYTIGGDLYSIGFDGSDKYRIYHQRNDLFIDSSSSVFNFLPKPKSRWLEDDVIGCLIDFNRKRFDFYVNGKLVKYNEREVHFGDQPYYAAASLNDRQMCYFNLGQSKFKYAPVNVDFKTFYQNEDALQALSYCVFVEEVLANSQVDIFFDDLKQKEIDQLANQIEKNILDNTAVMTFDQNNLSKNVRIIQSLIELSGTKLHDFLDIQAWWIASLIAKSTDENPIFLEIVCLVICPYFTLHLTKDTESKHRNVCMVLACLFIEIEKIKAHVNLFQKILFYLTQIVTKYDQVIDDWMLLYALVGIENLELHQNDVDTLKSNATFCKIIETKQKLDLNDPQIFSINLNLPLMRQSVFISQWFCQKILSFSPTIDQSLLKPWYSESETLNPAHSSPYLKLSPDLLSARSDRQFESVRSISGVSSGRYYFEVTLLTNGPMRFGWASENTDLTRGKLGDDEYSIGFDGYHRCVWHGGRSYPVKNVQRWNVQDVVGCMISAMEKTFYFNLNGESLYLSFRPHYSLVQPYHASASLSTFQQCRFNFGDILKYRPRRHSFGFMDSLRRDFIYRSKIPNFKKVNSVVNNSIFLVESRSILAGNITITTLSNSESTNNSLSSEKNNSFFETALFSFDKQDEDNLDEQNN